MRQERRNKPAITVEAKKKLRDLSLGVIQCRRPCRMDGAGRRHRREGRGDPVPPVAPVGIGVAPHLHMDEDAAVILVKGEGIWEDEG
jgi:hypothetical protein